ncbi:MAG: hypothetical protein ACKONH_02035, partial [Planctomycetia bacterium]
MPTALHPAVAELGLALTRRRFFEQGAKCGPTGAGCAAAACGPGRSVASAAPPRTCAPCSKNRRRVRARPSSATAGCR